MPSAAELRADPGAFYRVEWQRLDMPRALRPSQRVRALVALRNGGRWVWPDPQLADPVQRTARGAVRLGWRWLRGDSDDKVTDYATRVDLPWPLRPGESIVLPLYVEAPPAPGTYRLQVALVHEMVAWFASQGATDLLMPVSVGP